MPLLFLRRIFASSCSGLAALFSLALSFPSFGQTVAEGDSGLATVHVLHQGRPVAGAEVWRVVPMNRYRDSVEAVSTRIGQTAGDGTIAVPVRMRHGRIWDGSRLYVRASGNYAGFTGMHTFIDPDSVAVNLFPSKSVSGLVRDSRGRPVPGAEITIWNISGSAAGENSQIDLHGTVPGSSAKSDARGRFTLSGIPEVSRINIFAAAPGKATLCVRDIPSGMENLGVLLEPESRITGRVVLDTGEPVKGIGVELREKLFSPWSSGDTYCVTDADGRFSFGRLSSGMYLVQSYTDSTLRDWIAPPLENIGVGRGKTAENMDIKLVRGVPLTGMVVEEQTGEPVLGARVSARLLVSNPSDPYNEALYISLSSAWTDTKGKYRLSALPGDIQLWAGFPTGNGMEVTGQQHVTVEPQDSLVTGVNLAVARGNTLRGVVKLPDGSPAAEAEIFCGFFTSAYTDSNGEFTIQGIRSGGSISYFACTPKRDMEAYFTAKIDSASTVEVTLHPARFVPMEGIVEDEQGKPVSGLAVYLNVGEGAPTVDYGGPKAVTDREGRFRMDRIRAGRYYRFGIRESLAGSESFLAGSDTGPIRIVLPKTDRWLEGTVNDAEGKPLSGMRVDAWGEGGRAQTTTDGKGFYRLEGLASEKVEIAIRGVPGHFNFMSIPTNQRRDFTLPTGRHYLSGRVTDIQGKPIPGTRISIDRPEARNPLAVETDSGGNFYLSGLGYASVTITASGPGFREQTLRVRTDREDVRFRLERAGKR